MLEEGTRHGGRHHLLVLLQEEAHRLPPQVVMGMCCFYATSNKGNILIMHGEDISFKGLKKEERVLRCFKRMMDLTVQRTKYCNLKQLMVARILRNPQSYTTFQCILQSLLANGGIV